jgi:UDP-N-acetylglucosamine 2-epimerase (non-hydrolysing)
VFEHTLIHTGQNYDYELNEIFFRELDIRRPNCFLESAGGSAAETIGKVIISADAALQKYQPEAVLILGDTNSSLAAISAKRLRIPIFHMEAGNRCFDQRVPEEINRRIVDHIADINLTYSNIAREYLLREGLPPDRVIKTGSPMYEVLNYYKAGIDASDARKRFSLEAGHYCLVSAHREENIDSDVNFGKLLSVLNGVADRFNEPVIVSTHPRTQKRIDKARAQFHPMVRLLKPLGFMDYVRLQIDARAVISDSGTITEESSILNFPALNIREAHERPEGIEEASVMMTGLDLTRILQGFEILKTQERGDNRTLRLVADYSMPNVSDKVVRIVQSYCDYVMRTVWRQSI